jgi:hypothetical protein
MHPVLNIKHLKKHVRSTRFANRMVLPDLRVSPHEEEYEVEKIVDQHFNKSKKRREFLVRWKGYGPEHDTFEPEKKLEKCLWQIEKIQEPGITIPRMSFCKARSQESVDFYPTPLSSSEPPSMSYQARSAMPPDDDPSQHLRPYQGPFLAPIYSASRMGMIALLAEPVRTQ